MAVITTNLTKMESLVKAFSPRGYRDCQFIIKDLSKGSEPTIEKIEAGFYYGIKVKNCMVIHEEE